MNISPGYNPGVGSRLEAAFVYARFGFKVFPLFEVNEDGRCTCGNPNCGNSTGKHPRVKEWQALASTDEPTIRAWWERWPSANVGVKTGLDSNLTVLDVDGAEGAATLKNFEINTEGCAELPPTPCVITGGKGGRQYYFQHVPGLGNRVRFAPGLDIRNDGGYVVGAGSAVNSAYSFEEDCGLGDIALAQMPGWLIERIKNASRFKQANNNGTASNSGKAHTSQAEIESTLSFIDCEDHDTWLMVGMGIHHEFGGSQAGFEIWSGWSSDSSKYDEDDQRKRWASFSVSGNGTAPTTIKSLFKLARENGWTGYQQAEEERPTIIISGGGLSVNADAAVQAIANPDQYRIFKQEDRLLEVATLDDEESSNRGVRRPKGAVMLRSLTNARLIDILTQAAHWQSADAKGKLHQKNAPKNVAETILGRHSWPPIKELIGMVEAPTIILDSGEILERPGYHSSGLYLAYAGPPLVIPPHPTRGDAIKAVAILKKPFEQFPFVEPVHCSAYLAALITANLRRQFLTAPAFSFNAPARSYGTGKTLLCDGVGIITTGRDCAKMALPEDDENELRKRLFGLLLVGDTVAALDNITGVLRSPFISAVLTSTEFKERQLGFIQNPTVRTNMMLLFNGNALVLAGDISTRTVPIELDANLERPAQRDVDKFEIPALRAYLASHRHELVEAMLTLLRAYFNAGAPTQKLPTYGRYEEWTAFIRQPLVWAAECDPYEAVDQIIEGDPDRTDAEAVFEAWFTLFGDREVLLQDLVTSISPEADEGNSLQAHALRNAIADVVFTRRNEINSRAFGQWCKKSKGLIANAKRLMCRSAGGG